jgi:sugar/nucleoside kinase (ribokinase family)
MIAVPSEIFCFGHVMADVVFAGIDDIPRVDEERYTSSFVVEVGGGAAIAAIALSRLELETALISAVGNDALGNFIAERLAANGVNISRLRRYQGHSGISMEISFPEGRATTTGMVAAESLAFDNPLSRMQRASHLHIVGPLTRDHQVILDLAQEGPMKISLDPNGSMQRSMRLFERYLPKIDLILPNQNEARGWHNLSDVSEIARELGKQMRPGGLAVVKLGAAGAVASDGGSVVHARAPRVNAIDTTGCGDAFAAGMIYASVHEYDLPVALHIANTLGAASACAMGGVNGLPSLQRLNELLSNQRSG